MTGKSDPSTSSQVANVARVYHLHTSVREGCPADGGRLPQDPTLGHCTGPDDRSVQQEAQYIPGRGHSAPYRRNCPHKVRQVHHAESELSWISNTGAIRDSF